MCGGHLDGGTFCPQCGHCVSEPVPSPPAPAFAPSAEVHPAAPPAYPAPTTYYAAPPAPSPSPAPWTRGNFEPLIVEGRERTPGVVLLAIVLSSVALAVSLVALIVLLTR